MVVVIRDHVYITGFKRGDLLEKIALYADDTLLFLANATCFLPKAVKVISTFGQYSGLVINRSKSTLLPMDVTGNNEACTRSGLNLNLGINIF